MTTIVEADEQGAIRVAGDLLGAKPHARYAIEQEGSVIVIRPVSDVNESMIEYPAHWKELTPQQRAKRFLQFASRQQPSDTHLTDEQLRRENIYD